MSRHAAGGKPTPAGSPDGHPGRGRGRLRALLAPSPPRTAAPSPGSRARALPRRAASSGVRGARRALSTGGRRTRARGARGLCGSRGGRAPRQPASPTRAVGRAHASDPPPPPPAVRSGAAGTLARFLRRAFQSEHQAILPDGFLFFGRWQLRGGNSLGEFQGRGYEEEITESVALRLASRDPPSSNPDVFGGR